MNIKLKHPIIKDGKTFGELVFPDRAKVKHMKSFPLDASDAGFKWTLDKMAPVLADALGIPVEVIDEIDMEDLPAVMEAFVNFFGQSPQTGANVSGQ